MNPQPDRLSLLEPPYLALRSMPIDAVAVRHSAGRGKALVWSVGSQTPVRLIEALRTRPGGTGLVLVLPEPGRLSDPARLLRLVEVLRPVGILPHFEGTDADDLVEVLKRPPADPAVEVTEYLGWRGLTADRETTRLIRRTIELSTDIRSVAALSRALYLSRRALGRRFLRGGLPVPSHWLHFARLLRVVFRLQNSRDSVLNIGYQYGYPDGFSLSNQMLRLTGVRPSEARACLGWEWFMEAWLRTEAEAGSLAPVGVDAQGREARTRSRARAGVGDDEAEMDATADEHVTAADAMPEVAPWPAGRADTRDVEKVARRAG